MVVESLRIMGFIWTFLSGNAELIGTIFAIICVVLIVKQNSLNFPIGIVKDIFILIVFVQYGLYASGISQIVLLGLSFYGWYKWIYGGKDKAELKVSRLGLNEGIACFAIWFFGSLGFATLVQYVSTITKIAPPSYVYWDSSITVAIFIAYWLMARKKIENWIVWLVFVNAQYLPLNILKQLYFFTALQPIYIGLAIYGLILWWKDLQKNQTATNELAAI